MEQTSSAGAHLGEPGYSHPSNFHSKYLLGEVIGKGERTNIYLGMDRKTGELIVVKQVDIQAISPSTTQDDLIERFRRERDLRRELDHQHIVTYLGYEENSRHLFIFLDYATNGSIRRSLDKYGAFQDDLTKSFTSQIISGLQYLHAKGIIHRNLQANNVLVDTSGICKISGFGMSTRAENTNDDPRAFAGLSSSSRWMAPEMFLIEGESERIYDAKVDIWGVGCVVLEMWSGELPWGGETESEIKLQLSHHKQPPVPTNLQLDPLAEQFRLECFEINPQDRPSADQLKNHQYLQQLPLN